MLSRLLRLFHTVRYLRPAQLSAYIWHRLHRPRPDLSPAPALRARPSELVQPIATARSMLSPTCFEFLNEAHELRTPADWNAADRSALWLYNLHYFDDLSAADSAIRAAWHRDLIARWIAENPPGHGMGWHAYPASRRVVNWIKWAWRGSALDETALHSLAVQARWVAARLEWHLGANHLLANAKALVFAGLFFDGAEARRWLECGMRVLDREISEQVLRDGGHFELSPMYHCIVLEDLLDVLNAARARSVVLPSVWLERMRAMLTWLHALVHPDGQIAFFNDAAFGISADLAALKDYATRLGLVAHDGPPAATCMLRDSGYARLEAYDAVLLMDCAHVGPGYQPGHAHADTLSFELSLFGKRALVNSGTSEYGTGEGRRRQRATAAHNTVVVDETNSSDVWSGFRVGRRAHPSAIEFQDHNGELSIACSHDGYRHLRGRNTHARRWTLGKSGLTIEDTVRGGYSSAVAFFHFHPDVALRVNEHAVATLPGAVEIKLRFEGAEFVELRESTWHPHFGESIPSSCIAVGIRNGALSTRIEWPQAASMAAS